MIYVLGDSFTYGQGVSNEHTWYNQLGELLNIKCYNINRQSIDWRKGDESEEFLTATNYFLAKMLNKHLHKLTDIEMLIIQWTAPLRDSDIDEDTKFSHDEKIMDKIEIAESCYLRNPNTGMSDIYSEMILMLRKYGLSGLNKNTNATYLYTAEAHANQLITSLGCQT